MIVVAGPRIDPGSLPRHDGLEVVAYVHNLYRHFAACDLAVVPGGRATPVEVAARSAAGARAVGRGGLTTSMELAANGRPFLYFPLRHHFEQNVHVRHRLQNY